MSFYTSLTGLNAATSMLGVTANNIANVGTTGFKRSRADFGDIFATSPLQKASSTVGQGVSLKQVSQEFSQGNIAFSSNALDLAITGDGFFPMRSADGLQDTYTRNGTFLLNEQYNVVNSAGQRLMAATVDSTGSANVNDRVVLTIPQKTTGEAKQTSQVTLGLNFPADAAVITDPFNRANPATYSKSTALTVYDAGGNGYLATIYYAKTRSADATNPTNTWQTHVYVGDNKVEASLQQATDTNGSALYVNQYGELAPYNEVKDLLTTAKTQLFSLNDLTDLRSSVAASVSGDTVTQYDFSNGDNFKTRNDTKNLTDLAKGATASALQATATALESTDAQAAVISDAIATATIKAKTYPAMAMSTNYAAGLKAATDAAAALATAAVGATVDTIKAAKDAAAAAYALANNTEPDAITAAADSAVAALGAGASTAQIDAARLRATAQLNASYNAIAAGVAAGSAALKTQLGVTDLTEAQLTAVTAAATAAADSIGFYDQVKVDLSQIMSVDVESSGQPVGLDLSYLASTDQKITGSAMATAVTNTLNREFGDECYFDLSDPNSQFLRITSSGYNTIDALNNTVEHPISIALTPGTTPGLGVMSNADGTAMMDSYGNPVVNAKKVTVDQMVAAIQSQLDAANSGNTIKASYDYATTSFKFMDGSNTIKLDTPPSVAKNELFKLSLTAVTLNPLTGHYDAKVMANGVTIRASADQRYGMAMTYDSVNKMFVLKSGVTGDTSSLAITGVAPNSVAADMLGLAANGTPSDAPVNAVDVSAVAVRGTPSTPATAVGNTPLKNIANNFAVDATNNTFQVTIDGVKGTVVLPVRSDYSLDTFKAELQRGINAMGANSPAGDPVSVNGVKVDYDDIRKCFTVTSGTAGIDSYVKISGSGDWGMESVDAQRGKDSTWIKPTQHKDIVNGVSQPKYIDSQGNETTAGDGFTTLPAWSPVYLSKGQLTFNTAGKLLSPKNGTQLEPVYLTGGKGVLTINVNYGSSTQYTSPFAVLSQSQDGAPEGDLVGVTIANDGLVSASFSNGTTKSLAKILLANFSSPVGLRQTGDSTFLATAASGKATLGNPGSAGFGTLRAGATERANVDLTQELVDLITAQRNFQANAKAIETSSTMTSAIINLRS